MEYKNISFQLDERQNIINSISEVDKSEFIQLYDSMELFEIDAKIRDALQEQLSEVKKNYMSTSLPNR